MSWKSQRASAQNSFKNTLIQYQGVYPYIFYVISKLSLQYFLVPQEALFVDKEDFVESLFFLMGLDLPNNPNLIPEIKNNVNTVYYKEYKKNRIK